MSRSATSASSRVEELVREIQAGRSPDKRFQELFQRLFPSAVHFFVNRGFSAEDAEDLAQDVLLGVYKGVGRFRFEATFETWIYRILTNVWRNALRGQTTLEGRAEKTSLDSPRAPGERRPSQETAALRDPARDPLQRALADERLRLLRAAVEELPTRMRQCVLLRVGQGLKYREIAEVLGLGISSVKTHLSAARERLKPRLEEHFEVFDL